MPKYIVKNNPLMIKGGLYARGSEVEMSEKEAGAFGEDLELVAEEKAPELIKKGYYKNKDGKVIDLSKMSNDGMSAEDLADQGWEKATKAEYDKANKSK
jgi:hypothetical protein